MHLPRTALRLGVALLLTTALSASAQDWKGRGRVNGEIDDEAGQPIAGAAITLRLQSAPEQGPAPLKTDKHGKFSYLGLTGGAWSVHIEAEGLIASEGVVSVSEFQPPPPLRITLRKAEKVEAPKPDPRFAEAQAAIDQGDSYFQSKNASGAKAEYEKALALLDGPEQAANRQKIRVRISQCQIAESDSAGAVETLKTVLAESPNDSFALRLIVDQLVVLKRQAEADEYIARLSQAGSGLDKTTLLNMAINLYNTDKLPEAIEKLSELVSQYSDWPDAYYFRGRAYLAQGKYDLAKADFQHVLDIGKDSPYAAECAEMVKSLK